MKNLFYSLFFYAIIFNLYSQENSNVWNRWEYKFKSTVSYTNPYKDVILSVSYYGPGGETFSSYGFWDGEDDFIIRCAFPIAGKWTWKTSCSDSLNKGLHGLSGYVNVTAYTGDNSLYKNGFLKVSDNNRYLVFNNQIPFLWIGCTAWFAQLRASIDDWKKYIDDRKSKHFSIIQIAPATQLAAKNDIYGNKPFINDTTIVQWNPVYWRVLDEMTQYANQQGIVIFLNGLMEPSYRYPTIEDAKVFARNCIARLYGNFVIFSPSFDSPYMALGDSVGIECKKATTRHLITQHPNTPSTKEMNNTANEYYHKSYLDFCMIQSGHNGGDKSKCRRNAITWNFQAYQIEPHKPVINGEAFYDANGTTPTLHPKYQGTAKDARATGYLSFLSGALGYTYGAYGLWNWESDQNKAFYWAKAIQYPSSMHMKYMFDFFNTIEWWKLIPSPNLIINQDSENDLKKMMLAKSNNGELAVAYLPENEEISIDMSAFPFTMKAIWYNPVEGKYYSIKKNISNTEIHKFIPEYKSDWILFLSKIK